MKRLSILFFVFIFTLFTAYSQINEGGQPASFNSKINAVIGKTIPFQTLDATHIASLRAEDAIRDPKKESPWRFGENIMVGYDMYGSGTWSVLPNGDKIWRLGIYSPGALTINLTFDQYRLPKGAKLFVYSHDKEHVIGAFTHKNNQESGVFATTLVMGDAVVIEYYEPAVVEFQGELRLWRVTHGYRNAFDYAKGLNTSGACNNNVACAVSAGWEDQIKSVAMMVTGGNGFCTGALVNNTANDGTPYFLTANHCYSDPTSWVFWFNWQSATCSNPGASPAHDDISGATLRARSAGSDFCLVELSSAPPAGYNVFYAGWDNSGTTPTSQVCIHHPDGDIKKISFDNNPATAVTWSSAACWEIAQWEDGTTEPGSSGSPLFDQNHRIIGQLYGGTASCSSITDDNFGRFATSWTGGGTDATRLSNWLDPSGTGATTDDGYDPNTPTVALDAQMLMISAPSGRYCDIQDIAPSVTIKNRGTSNLTSALVSYNIDGGTTISQNWNGNLATNETAIVSFPTITLTQGDHTINASVSAPNGGTDENTSNDALSSDYTVVGTYQTVELTILTDNYGEETSWQVVDDATSNVIYAGGGYASSTTYNESFCLSPGCYTFTIFDTFGDGICCTYGNGSYSLTNATTSESYVAGGGSFATSESTPFCIVASGPPVADFSANPMSVCDGESVQYTDLSTGAPTSWLWTFENGTPGTSTDQNPVVTYTVVGAHRVTLEATNLDGADTKTINNYITVNANPAITATPTDESTLDACDGAVTTSVSGGATPYSYSWDLTNTTTFSPGGVGALPLNSTVVFDLPVTGLGNMDGTSLYIESICIDVTHSRLSRLDDISLISPTGTSVMLTGNIGGTSADYTGTCFSMTGADGAIAAGTAPYTGIWIPMGDFANYYNGQTANGTWQLSLTCANTAGTLNSWEITFGTASTSTDLADLCAGTYNVTVTDNNGCTATTGATVNAGVSAPIASISASTDASCQGLCDGQATAAASGGTPPYTYAWSTGGTAAIETNLCVGTYTVTVTDNASLSSTAEVTINEPVALSVAVVSQTNILCNGEATGGAEVIASNGTPGYTYNWSGGENTAAVSNLLSGTYTVTATDANGCTATNTITLTENAAIAINLTVTDISCFGAGDGQISADVTGGSLPYSYLWSPGGQATQNAQSLVAGTYTLEVTDMNGCFLSSAATVNEPAEIILSSTSTNASCSANDGSATVSVSSGGVAPFSYAWETGGTASTETGLAAGTYSVVVTDSDGCTSQEIVSVFNNAAPLVSIISNTNVSCNSLCDGSATVTVSGGTTPYTYLWENGATGITATNLCAGNTGITVTDGLGCIGIASIVITEPDVLTGTVTGTNISCFGLADGTADVAATGGTTPYTYIWSNGGTLPGITGLSADTYTVAVTDQNGCTYTGQWQVTEPLELYFSATVANATCYGNNDGSITVTPGGGTPPYTITWSTFETGQTISNLVSGNYGFTITDANNCEISGIEFVDQPAMLSVSVSTTEASNATAADGTATANATGGSGMYTYNWNDGQNTPTATGLVTGFYCVTVTDDGACTAVACDSVLYYVGVNTIEESYLTVYPNPTNGILKISSDINGKAYLYVKDILGQIVTEESVMIPAEINLSTLKDGTYFLEIITGERRDVVRVVMTK